MDAEIKRMWIAALMSGEYRQARNVLRAYDGGMCCLGVLREIVAPGSEDSYQSLNTMPVPELLSRTGLSMDQAGALAKVNDNGPQDEFATVCTVIRAFA